MSRILFAGGIHAALRQALAEFGHIVWSPDALDWWRTMESGGSPGDWASAVALADAHFEPDVFVLSKGLHGDWQVPTGALWEMRRRGVLIVLVCHDDPAVAPLLLLSGIAAPAHYWLSSCAGIRELFPWGWSEHTKAQVVEWWLAWDERLPVVDRAEHRVDVAVCGTPYWRPFPRPHYQAGFSGPRRSMVRSFLDAGLTVGLWGSEDWCDPDRGGALDFASIWRGKVPFEECVNVYRSARTVWGSQLVQGYRYESGKCVWVGGAGGLLIHEERPGLREEFGGSVLWHNPGDANHALAQIRLALSDDFAPTRNAIVRDLHSITMDRHLWRHRAATMHGIIANHRRSS